MPDWVLWVFTSQAREWTYTARDAGSSAVLTLHQTLRWVSVLRSDRLSEVQAHCG